MARKKFTMEKITGYLRQVISRGCKVENMLREIDVTTNMYYHWRKDYRSLGMDQPSHINPTFY